MRKFIGYIIAGVGLIGMALSPTVGNKVFPVIGNISRNYVLIPSLALVGLGVVILIVSSKGKKAKQYEREVPIYKGKKIVGYRMEE